MHGSYRILYRPATACMHGIYMCFVLWSSGHCQANLLRKSVNTVFLLIACMQTPILKCSHVKNLRMSALTYCATALMALCSWPDSVTWVCVDVLIPSLEIWWGVVSSLMKKTFLLTALKVRKLLALAICDPIAYFVVHMLIVNKCVYVCL